MRQISKTIWLSLLLTVFMTVSAVAQKGVTAGQDAAALAAAYIQEAVADPTTANAGDEVKLTVTPTDGYYVSKVTVKKVVGIDDAQSRRNAPGFAEDVEVTAVEAESDLLTGKMVYSFTMPETAVEYYVEGAARTTITAADFNYTNSFVYNGYVQKPEVTTTLDSYYGYGATTGGYVGTAKAGIDYLVAYQNADSKDVNPDAAGDPTPYKITIKGLGKYYGQVDLEYTITPKDLADEMINIVNVSDPQLTQLVYTGSPLVNGTDYQVVIWDGNDGTDDILSTTDDIESLVINGGQDVVAVADDYTVEVTGKNNYQGTVSKQFAVAPRPVNNAVITITGAPFVYNGAAHTPAYTVVDDLGNAMTKDVDYTEAWANNVNVYYDGDNAVLGNVQPGAQLIITGLGNYDGNTIATELFQIDPKQIDAATVTNSFTNDLVYNGHNQQLADLVLADSEIGSNLVENTDYNLTYADNRNSNAAGANPTVTVDGRGNYTGSVDINFNIAQRNLSDVTINDIPNRVYDIDPIDLTAGELVVTVPGDEQETEDDLFILERDFDYNVTYTNNVHVGTATVNIAAVTGSNFTGTNSATFTIDPKSIADFAVEVENVVTDESSRYEVYFNDQEHKANPTKVTWTDKGVDLVATTEYTFDWNDGTDYKQVGTHTVTISGTGDYTGELVAPYTIVDKSIADFNFTINLWTDNTKTVAVDDDTYVYERKEHKPYVELLDENGVVVRDELYEVTYEYNQNATAVSLLEGYAPHVIVVGKDGYVDQIAKLFNINQAPVSDATRISISEYADSVYTGYSIEQNDLKVVDNITGSDVVLEKDTEYTVDYSANTHVADSPVTVTISGKGNYTGTTPVQFNILPKSVTGNVTFAAVEAVTYNRAEHKPEPKVIDDANGRELVKDIDFTYSWTNNINADAYRNANGEGLATITITGQNDYKDTELTYFVIDQRPIEGFDVVLTPDEFLYNSEAKQPATVTVTDPDGNYLLDPSTNSDKYDVVYLNNTDPGTAIAQISADAAANYKGVIEAPYTIYVKSIAGNDVISVAGDPAVTLDLAYTTTVYDGREWEPATTVKYGDITLVENTDYVVEYKDNVNVGTATVIVAGIGKYNDEITTTFAITPRDINANAVIADIADVVYTGREHTPAITVTDPTIVAPGRTNLYEGIDYTVAYTNNVNAGQATVTITGIGNYDNATSKDATFVIQRKDLTADMIHMDNFKTDAATGFKYYNFVYNGANQKPTVAIVDDDNDPATNPATQGMTTADYVITNDGGVEVGNYTVSVEGQHNYKGTVTADYSIVSENAVTFDVTLAANTTSALTGTGSDTDPYTSVYNAQDQKPTVTVVSETNGTVVPLVENTHYTVEYKNNHNVGKALVVITGIGTVNATGEVGSNEKYEGTVVATFDITPKSITATSIAAIDDAVYTGSPIEPLPIVTDGAETLVLGKDYYVNYEANLNITKPVVNETKVIVTGINNYKDAVDVNYTINPKSIAEADVENGTSSVSLGQIAAVEYNGVAHTPAPVLSYNGLGLVAGQDYTVAYDKNVNASAKDGDATVTITAVDGSNYTGSRATTFVINQKPLNKDMVRLSKDPLNPFYYNGSEQRPNVQVFDYIANVETELAENVDYTKTIPTESTEIGDYTITVTAVANGNYSGEVTADYSIVNENAVKFTASLSQYTYTYTGSAIVPEPTVVAAGNVNAPLPASNYDVEYLYNTNVGKALVTITGKNGYEGKVTLTFDIVPKNVNELAISGIQNVVYNGDYQRPAVTVTYGDITLVENTDYVVAYDNNLNVGTASVTITGMGNYTGQVVKHFIISPKQLDPAWIAINPLTFVYNGENQKPVVAVVDADLDRPLAEGADYMLTNLGGVDVGTYNVLVVGIGNYTSAAPILNTFDITPAPIAVVAVDDVDAPEARVALDTEATVDAEGVDATTATVTWSPADAVAQNATVYTATVTLTPNSNYMFDPDNAPAATFNGEAVNAVVTPVGTLVVGYTFPVTSAKYDDPTNPDIVYELEPDQDNLAIIEINNVINPLYVPGEVTINGTKYVVNEIAENAFDNLTDAQKDQFTDVYLNIDNAGKEYMNHIIDVKAMVETATIHAPLALLADYALMPGLEANYKAIKVLSDNVKNPNRMWTISSAVDVIIPAGLDAYKVVAKPNTNDQVSMQQIELNQSNVDGTMENILSHNNGVVLVGATGTENTVYTIKAFPGRQYSGDEILSTDAKDYGTDNLLEPVIRVIDAANDQILGQNFDPDKYYVLYGNEFRIINAGDQTLVAPSKAVLAKPSATSSRTLTITFDDANDIKLVEALYGDGDNKWYDLLGNRIARPTKAGIYILNGHKVAIK